MGPARAPRRNATRDTSIREVRQYWRQVFLISRVTNRASLFDIRLDWLGDLDSNQGCPVQSREFYR